MTTFCQFKFSYSTNLQLQNLLHENVCDGIIESIFNGFHWRKDINRNYHTCGVPPKEEKASTNTVTVRYFHEKIQKT
jgi:hypothetical protein